MFVSAVIGWLVCVAIAWAAAVREPLLQHWSVVVLTVCGALVSIECIDCIRGRRDFMQPTVILSALGTHFFFLAPLLHVITDAYMQYVVPPPDWRPWFGQMAFFNVAGLVIWRLGQWVGNGMFRRSELPVRALLPGRMHIVFPFLLLVSLVLQAYVYASYGGLSGYINTFEDLASGKASEGFSGMGWVFTISESFPALLAVYVFGRWMVKRTPPSWPTLGVFLVVLVVAKMFFGGFRGSRSETIWFVFWMLGIIHYAIRRVSRPMIVGCGVAMVLFMYVYGFYKSVGSQGIARLAAGEEASQIATDTGRSFTTLMLHDFGRADVQAFLLYRYREGEPGYQLAWGNTYIASLTYYIPSALGIPRMDGKIRYGTEIQYGQGSFRPPRFYSTLIYGLGGEALLNFGPYAIAPVYFFLGLAVAFVEAFIRRLQWGDARWLIVPLLHYSLVLMMTSDSDNVYYVWLKTGLLPVIALAACSTVLSSRRQSVSRPLPAQTWHPAPVSVR